MNMCNKDFIEAGIKNHIHHCPQMLLRGGYAYAGDKEKLRSKIFEDGAEYGYQYALQHPQWISVKEEDPPQTLTWDNPIYFLGVTDKGGIHKMYRMGDPTICKDLENDNLYLHVTHWMPIIPLPKK